MQMLYKCVVANAFKYSIIILYFVVYMYLCSCGFIFYIFFYQLIITQQYYLKIKIIVQSKHRLIA